MAISNINYKGKTSGKTPHFTILISLVLVLGLLTVSLVSAGDSTGGKNILIHVKTSLALDDAQICVAPNVAWAALKAGHKVTILFDASAVTSITKGFGWFRRLTGSKNTALDRAPLPERERKSLSEQTGESIKNVPKDYGEYFHFLKEKGVPIYVNKTMLVLYNIDPIQVDSFATPISLDGVVNLFSSADTVLVY